MKVTCPSCGKEGSAQIRGNNVRIGHYSGYKKGDKGQTIIITEWHTTTLEALNMVNNVSLNMVNNPAKTTTETENNIIYHEAPRLIIWRTKRAKRP